MVRSLVSEDPMVRFETEQLVVALTAADLVVAELEACGLTVNLPYESDEILGLALIDFSGLQAWDPPREVKIDLLENRVPTALDVLLGCLRVRLSNRFGGWAPVIAKNRIVGGLGVTNGQIGGGGAGEPQPVGESPGLSGLGVLNGQVGGGGGGEPQPVTDPSHGGTSSDGQHSGNGSAGSAATGPAGYLPGPADAGKYCRVALLDTRLSGQPRLLGKVLASQDAFLSEPGPYKYTQGHATFTAGLIVQQAPAAQLHAIAVLSGQDSTNTAWNVARAMARLVDADIDVLNLSLGCFTEDDRPPFVLQRAVDVLSPRTVIVAAAGNHATGEPTPRPFWPAALDNVVAVGACAGDPGSADTPTADFSPKLGWVDVEARGVDVISLYLSGPVKNGRGYLIGDFNGYARWAGTSAATATVAGRIAAAMRPGMSAPEVVAELRRGADPRVRPYSPIPVAQLRSEREAAGA